ncbi:MAG: hypothetical protein Q9161_005159 [Pseudevernia consocians]
MKFRAFVHRKAEAEKQDLQAYHTHIQSLRNQFPEGASIPSHDPRPNKILELRDEVDLLRHNLGTFERLPLVPLSRGFPPPSPNKCHTMTVFLYSTIQSDSSNSNDESNIVQLEIPRTSVIPRVPSHAIELDASQTVEGTSNREVLESTVHLNTDLNLTQDHTKVDRFNHLEIDLGIFGLKTLHLYFIGGFILAYILIMQLSEIAIKSIEIIEIISTVLKDPAVVRGAIVLGLGVSITVAAAVTLITHSNNARRVAEKGIDAQAQIHKQTQMLRDKGRLREKPAETYGQERMLTLENDRQERVLTMEDTKPEGPRRSRFTRRPRQRAVS